MNTLSNTHFTKNNRKNMYITGFFFWTLFSVFTSCDTKKEPQWGEYLGDADRNHYSELTQINPENVGTLQKAWEFRSGEEGQVQCNPIMVDGTLYGVTAFNNLFALNAETGEEIWRFKPEDKNSANVNRGVAYWAKGEDKRILYAYKTWLYAVNAVTGEVIETFGDKGRISLRDGLGAGVAEKFITSTTPGTIFEDIIIMPTRVSEQPGAAPGYIQAFNVLTGKVEWVFKTIPHPGEPGYDTWPADAYKNPSIGGANNWAGMAIDRKRGIVYIPTGSAAFDFYGGNRKGTNLYANCLLALEAKTGKYVWHYQIVHHDIWDRDLPAPPNLTTIKQDGKNIDVVVQVTKSGHTFVFDREKGTPIYRVDEVQFPASDLPGEKAWATQPIPRLPLPFARQQVAEEEITHFSNKRDSLLALYRAANKGTYQPLSLTKNTLLFPGADGGAEWGGAAIDKEGVMYVNANELPWMFSLSLKEDRSKGGRSGGKRPAVSTGKALYANFCQACHKADLTGNPQSGYPSLLNLKKTMKRPEINTIITNGKGMMPGFSNLSNKERQAIVDFILGEEKEEAAEIKPDEAPDVPYRFNGYNKFLDENGYPAITPPWGTLTAIDLNTGEHLWRIPLGEFKELTEKGIPATGTENYGGPVVTASGLLFIAATKDNKFRAYDKKTGKLLWEHELPASGFATPSTYSVNGKQYVVIACGGTKLGTNKGDSYVAFALPE